jgi:Bacterial low temperature requirement A protein (LtrA)
VSLAARARVGELAGAARATFARDAYSYLHFPMVAGIVLFAFGLETTLHDHGAPLGSMPAIGLCGGLALYLLGHVALRLRMGAGIGHGRPVAAAVLVVSIPVALTIPALPWLSSQVSAYSWSPMRSCVTEKPVPSFGVVKAFSRRRRPSRSNGAGDRNEARLASRDSHRPFAR